MGGFSRDVSFEVKDAEQRGSALVDCLRLIVGGTSLGGVESTIDRRGRWKGEDNVPGRTALRLSPAPFEHPVDLWADLDDALSMRPQECDELTQKTHGASGGRAP